jgi:alanine-synthesizing transaminase
VDNDGTINGVTTHHLPLHASAHHRPQRSFAQSSKLQDVLYEIRGPVHAQAARLEAEGHRILKLNIGNPAPFGLFTPDAVLSRVTASIADSQGYSDARGIAPAREAASPGSTSTTSIWATGCPS